MPSLEGKKKVRNWKNLAFKFAEKCKGLPIAAKTLGSFLRFKESKRHWQDVLESDIWKAISIVDNPVLPALLLSYNDVPSHLKQCFAYCSLIPKGEWILKPFTIREWMAQGFFSNSLAARNEDINVVGDEYNNLIMRSFFKKDITKSRAKSEYYQMHDLVHDFAKSIAENECFMLIRNSTLLEPNIYLLIEDIKVIPSFIYMAKNLCTLKIFGWIPSISFELFHHLSCLRTLSLGDTYLKELPNEAGKLIHLSYLDLSKASFKELPKAVTSLYNLLYLNLYGCRNLCKLPEEICRLVNLVNLRLTECHQLSYLPEGIWKLSRLRHLSDFIIGPGVESGECKIGELKDLNFLEHSLLIVGLERVENGNEAKMACLKNKQHLCALYFHFNQYTGVAQVDENGSDEEGEYREVEEEQKEEKVLVVDGEGKTIAGEETVGVESKPEGGDEEVDIGGDMLLKRMEDVMENLQPHTNLEKLIIRDYLGVVFPNWMDSHANFMMFSNLVFLELNGCRKCKQLPPTLGKLPSLETLAISKMDEVKFMGAEFFGFPKLKVVQLDAMWNLEGWDLRIPKEEEGKQFIFMPRLHYIAPIELPNLRSFP
ncbi:hypothetical protein NE237_005743 [Protea cynaroides]|uniref:NB-ARC domain-containing protein n=1 Tax=Protea cynaroides TaxID=273540 RepID=A0A9Q0QUV4_9MAGN|nr:hypothetical protein NE237_005743 [Protea cynaroides]